MKVIGSEDLNRVPGAPVARDRILRQTHKQRSLANTFEDLLGDGGPVEETADEMIRVIREWRDFPTARNLK